jgi:hypothetical protein
MDRIDLRFARDAQDVRDVEIRFDRPFALAYEVRLIGLRAMEREAVLVRIDHHSAHGELGRGTHDADGDFAAIGDQQATDALEHGTDAS